MEKVGPTIYFPSAVNSPASSMAPISSRVVQARSNAATAGGSMALLKKDYKNIISLDLWIELISHIQAYLYIYIFPSSFYGQRDAFQRDTKYFWHREAGHLLFLSSCIHLIAKSWLSTASTTPSLSGRRTIDPSFDQTRHVSVRIVLCFFDFARVDDVYNVVDSNGCLIQNMG